MGKAPLLVAYESQLVEFLLRHPQRRSGEMVMLYPQPTLYSKHVLVPYTPAGDRVGQLLESDPQLRALAQDRKSTRLNSSHLVISYAVFCLKKKTKLSTIV